MEEAGIEREIVAEEIGNELPKRFDRRLGVLATLRTERTRQRSPAVEANIGRRFVERLHNADWSKRVAQATNRPAFRPHKSEST